MNSKQTNSPMPWQLTIGKLRKAIEGVPDQAVVILHVPGNKAAKGPPWTADDFSTITNLQIGDVTGSVIALKPYKPEV